MRAMPSPIESTCPTSATSASAPKLAICCLRIAEISAARISIYLSPFHRKLQPVQLAAQRCIDHARSDFDDETAQQAGIDPNLDGDLAPHRLLQLLVDGAELRRRQLLRRDDLGGHLAAPRSKPRKEGVDHAQNSEEPAVLSDKPEKIEGQRRELGALGDGGDRLGLLTARQ